MKLVVAYSRNSTRVTTTYEYLTAFEKYWPGDVAYLHVANEAIPELGFRNYDVLLHNYCARLCFEGYVSEDYKKAVRNFKGLKILSVQDEYDHTDVLKAAIKDLGFDIVLTCVPRDQIHLVYPSYEFEGVEFLTVLTGYIDDSGPISSPRVKLAGRPNVVGYRGRNIGVRYGQLGFDKYEVGRWVRAYCQERGIKHDIEMDNADRIYGSKWAEFIRSCRTMLGSESGSNVFDFKGSFERKFNGIDFESPKASAVLGELALIEKKFDVGQISPRVFECAQNYTPMILYEGRYSDIIQPYQHYLPLKKDHSNIEEVFQAVERIDDLEDMATRAYEHLVASGQHSYRSFVEKVVKTVRGRQLNIATEERLVGHSQTAESGNHLEFLPTQKLTHLPKRGPEADIEGPFEAVSNIYLPALHKNADAWKRTTTLVGAHGVLARLTWAKVRLWRKAVVYALVIYKVADYVKSLTGFGEQDSDSALHELEKTRERFSGAREVRKSFVIKSDFLCSNEMALAEFQQELYEINAFVDELKSKSSITQHDVERINAISKRCRDLVRISYVGNDAVLL